jgi:hypothetical protein
MVQLLFSCLNLINKNKVGKYKIKFQNRLTKKK